ncbi:uncharacterized protein LOC123295502 [Chrysoperla carnea]|uniref:uncharacterized protein LOC123295502 n=1 Tax=Chrysoperla carnea TaxID=189513 RepID=UPI001D08D467|nr:uncharacterized protein LOC123295502 [Chrysoperla carnea]
MKLEEKLIEIVRKYPEMYDTSNCNYMKTKHKTEIWRIIGNDLGIDGEKAKDVWTKLRNNHRDALRRQRAMIKNGAAATEIKLWKFQSQMEFLLRYMIHDYREMNFTNDEERYIIHEYREMNFTNDEEQEPTQDEVTESDIKYSEDQIAEENDELGSLNTPSEGEENSMDSLVMESTKSPIPKKKVKKSDIGNLIQKNLDEREQSKKRDEDRQKLLEKIVAPTDDLYLFFISMYELTKKMPPTSQHIVKRNIFHAVSEEEARLLNISVPTYSSHQQFSQDLNTNSYVNHSDWSTISPNGQAHSPAATSNSPEETSDSKPILPDIVTYIDDFPS